MPISNWGDYGPTECARRYEWNTTWYSSPNEYEPRFKIFDIVTAVENIRDVTRDVIVIGKGERVHISSCNGMLCKVYGLPYTFTVQCFTLENEHKLFRCNHREALCDCFLKGIEHG